VGSLVRFHDHRRLGAVSVRISKTHEREELLGFTSYPFSRGLCDNPRLLKIMGEVKKSRTYASGKLVGE
jgi:hypothetical protein